MSRMDQFHFEHPSYGSRRLARQFDLSRYGAQKMMQLLHLEATYPKRKTSIPREEHKKYPYLLRHIKALHSNHLWSTDITYLPMVNGFMYLAAVMDWHSRMILSWRLSNTMDVNFCIECLQEAFTRYGEPEYFNSDQGSQFTSPKFQQSFAGHSTKISMDGKGRWVDNVFIERFWWTLKYEDVHLKRYETVRELATGLTEFIRWYNEERIHSSLSYKTPGEVYWGGVGEVQKFLVTKLAGRFFEAWTSKF
jgi:putative transposase